MRLSELEIYNPITIQCHDNPDADALASGYGLYCYYKSRGRDVRLVYSGRNRIHKSNLKLMVEKLELPVEYIAAGRGESVSVEGLLITVDCQYGAGNVTGLTCEKVAVVDHHQPEGGQLPALGVINPNLGSCSTLVWKLLQDEAFDVNQDEHLGTALYYGLYTDTNQFSELYNPLDMDMREAVKADMGLITLFRNSNLSLSELEIAGIALIRHSYNDDYEFAVIKAKPCDPNLLGLISDFLLQVDAIKTCVVFNETGDGYKFSVRSCIREVNASELAGFLAQDMGSGGGHYEKAGGFISLMRYEDKFPTMHTEAYFNNRMVQYFDSYDLIYAEEYRADPEAMDSYVRRRVPAGFVRLDRVLAEGTPVTLRTLQGDIEMTAEPDVYCVIGSRGEVRIVPGQRFRRNYEVMEDQGQKEEYLSKLEYAPVIKNRETGRNLTLADCCRMCVPNGEAVIYAKALEKGVKVFSAHDRSRYMLGEPGDFLAVSRDELSDVFVVEKRQFADMYERRTVTKT